MLSSGLPDIVADDEDLARFLTSSNQSNTQVVKPAAFLPSPKDAETSVFRHGSEPRAALWAIGTTQAAGTRTLHGAAIVKTSNMRDVPLVVAADEPPSRHAAIRSWAVDADPDLKKAKQKEQAMVIASKAMLLLK
jgi:hypothetical protein